MKLEISEQEHEILINLIVDERTALQHSLNDCLLPEEVLDNREEYAKLGDLLNELTGGA